MVKKSVVFPLLFLCIFSTAGRADQNARVRVREMVFCTAVDDRRPAGVDSLFSDTVGRVYCFTRISGATDTTSIYHVWYHDDEEKARVGLGVRSKSWRTWSSKQILKEWHGLWRVEVVSPGGRMLRSKEFLVKPTED